MILSRSALSNTVIFLTVLCSIHAYGLYYKFFSRGADFFNVVFYGLVFITFVFYMITQYHQFGNNKRFKAISNSIILLYLALILSSLSSLAIYGQNPLLSLFAARYFAFYLLFYILCFYAPTKEFIIKLITIFAIGYVLIFTIQILIYPAQIIPVNVDGLDRGLLRVRVEGVGFLTFGGLLALSHFLKTKKILFLLLFFIAVAYVFLLGFRTLIVIYIFSAIYLVYLVNKRNLKNILFSAIVLIVIGFIAINSGLLDDFYNTAMQRTEEQINKGDNYIRVKTFNFLFNYVTPSWEALVFGNGVAHESSSYGQLILNYGAKKNGYIVADLGLVGYLFYFGFFGLIAFLLVYLKVISAKEGENTLVIKVFFIYMILSSITTAEIFRAGMFGVSMVALYLYVLEGKKDENNE